MVGLTQILCNSDFGVKKAYIQKISGKEARKLESDGNWVLLDSTLPPGAGPVPWGVLRSDFLAEYGDIHRPADPWDWEGERASKQSLSSLPAQFFYMFISTVVLFLAKLISGMKGRDYNMKVCTPYDEVQRREYHREGDIGVET